MLPQAQPFHHRQVVCSRTLILNSGEKQKCIGRAVWGAGNRNLEVPLAKTVICLSDLCSGAYSILPAQLYGALAACIDILLAWEPLELSLRCLVRAGKSEPARGVNG